MIWYYCRKGVFLKPAFPYDSWHLPFITCSGYNRCMPDRRPIFVIILLFLVILLTMTRPVNAGRSDQLIPTSTPLEDGAIVHFVADGENLAMIAESYGLSMSDIRSMNGMAPDSNLIFPGQKLIIRLAPTVTLTPTITPVTPRPTRTPTPVTPTRTPAPTRTPDPTLTPTATIPPLVEAAKNFYGSYRQHLLIAMVVLCAAGAAWTLWAGFRKS